MTLARLPVAPKPTPTPAAVEAALHPPPALNIAKPNKPPTAAPTVVFNTPGPGSLLVVFEGNQIPF